MELIQIDTIKWTSTSYITTQIYSLPAAVFVDAETGVVYFNGMYPRYDANGRVMVIPRDQLPAIIARGRAQAAAASADKERNRTITQLWPSLPACSTRERLGSFFDRLKRREAFASRRFLLIRMAGVLRVA